jgi:RNA polymerase sigma factor (sigma-70 family)
VLLVFDPQTAEDVVGDAFAATCRGWRRPRDSEKALRNLRRAVVSESRSVRRRRLAARGTGPTAEPGERVSAGLERFAVVAALRELPRRQREAIVLRYYAGLTEAEVAAVMRVRRGTVQGLLARGLSSLSVVLAPDVRLR